MSQVLYSGFLKKKGNFNKAYKTRWFELKENTLFYFKAGNERAQGSINLTGATIMYDNNLHISIKIPNVKRIYELMADTIDEAEEWVSKLRFVTQPKKENMSQGNSNTTPLPEASILGKEEPQTPEKPSLSTLPPNVIENILQFIPVLHYHFTLQRVSKKWMQCIKRETRKERILFSDFKYYDDESLFMLKKICSLENYPWQLIGLSMNEFSLQSIIKEYKSLKIEVHKMKDEKKNYVLISLKDSKDFALRKIDSCFIEKILYAFLEDKTFYLVANHNPNNLKRILESKKLSNEIANIIIAEILLGIEYCHERKFYFSNPSHSLEGLNLEVIGIDESNHIVLNDYLMLAQLTLRKIKFKKNAKYHQLKYKAPELIDYDKTQEYNFQKCDVWAFGIIIHELLTSTYPFEVSEDENELMNVIKEQPINLSPELPEMAKDLLTKMLEKDIEKRINLEEVKNHPFFENVQWNEVISKKVNIPNL